MSQAIGSQIESAMAERPPQANKTLDPADWRMFRAQGHRMLDDMFDYIENIRDRPVWQPMPERVRARFCEGIPRFPAGVEAVHEEFLRDVLPFAAGNVHPGFMGWVHGGGTPVGMLAEMLAAGLNANLGGRDHAPVEVERQITRWVREIFGFPDTATGLFVTGTSMANLIAVIIARDVALGFEVRRRGLAAEKPGLTAYASSAAHGSIAKALDICGLGSGALRLIPTDGRQRMNVEALEDAIREDREAGRAPFLVVGTAGTVDTGAIDDLARIAELCAKHKLWFQVDGAYGALAKLAPELAPRLDGIERADSLAFDFHKWGQVPYDAGYLLVRDGALHRNAFATAAAYLRHAKRGLAAGADWPCDFGPDLSRGFRALKVWFTMKVYGTDALGGMIARSCELARYLASRLAETPELELLAPVELNIVCFRYRAEDSDRVNEEIVVALQESGIAAPSTTRIGGRLAIRAAIVNHRTDRAEIDALVDNTLAQGRALKACLTQGTAAQKSEAPSSEEALRSMLQSVEDRLAAMPASTQLLLQRGYLLEGLGRGSEAEKAYRALLEREPSHVGALNMLGRLLLAHGEDGAARGCYAEAIAKHPDDAMSRVNFGNFLYKTGSAHEARKHFEHALKVDPGQRPAHAGLAFAFADLGNPERALRHGRKAFQGRCILPPGIYRGDAPPVRVLELNSITGGTIRLSEYLSNRTFLTHQVIADFVDSHAQLPPHDLVVNAISNPEIAGEALRRAQSLLDHTAAPVINRPEAVLATGRCEIARQLSALPGVVTAKTVSLTREALSSAEVLAVLNLHGLEFPLLLRKPGQHQGAHFFRVEAASALPGILKDLPGEELLAMEFLDARGPDGKIRKYRVMTIDGRLYPLHVAIASHWKVHYFSADMKDDPGHRAEEAEFLGNMERVLGSRAMTALGAIQKTLGLDYGGIDFGLNASGEVLLFEANAAMAILQPDADQRWDYRRPAIETAREAVRTMLRNRAAIASRQKDRMMLSGVCGGAAWSGLRGQRRDTVLPKQSNVETRVCSN